MNSHGAHPVLNTHCSWVHLISLSSLKSCPWPSGQSSMASPFSICLNLIPHVLAAPEAIRLPEHIFPQEVPVTDPLPSAYTSCTGNSSNQVLLHSTLSTSPPTGRWQGTTSGLLQRALSPVSLGPTSAFPDTSSARPPATTTLLTPQNQVFPFPFNF